jgi:hypothetical protein
MEERDDIHILIKQMQEDTNSSYERTMVSLQAYEILVTYDTDTIC